MGNGDNRPPMIRGLSDTNFDLIQRAVMTLESVGLFEEAKEMAYRAIKCGSKPMFLQVLNEYVCLLTILTIGG